MTDPSPPRELLGLEAVKLLAHPLRRRIQQQLRQGPVTSTTLARALGESTGLTSYHLRQLAQHGFVEEVPELSNGRERWWRFVAKDRRFPRHSEQDPEMRSLMDQMNLLDFAGDLEQLAQFQTEREAMGQWQDALPFSRGSIRVTLEELQEFFEEYIKLLHRFNRPEEQTPAGAREVLTRFFAFPAPAPSSVQDTEDTGGGDLQ
jgi:DNA-binding transcriptional ArsR family regulator